MASKFMKSYSTLIGKQFLKNLFGKEIEAICRDPKEGGAGMIIFSKKLRHSMNFHHKKVNRENC